MLLYTLIIVNGPVCVHVCVWPLPDCNMKMLLGIVCLHELLAVAVVGTYAWNSCPFLLMVRGYEEQYRRE